MLDVIIVGSEGKAGLLHYNSYKKINLDFNIYFVDIKSSNNTYTNVKAAIDDNQLDVKNIIVDICTPVDAYFNIILEAYKLGVRNYIVEKPFVVNNEFFNTYNDIKIAMVENYLFSEVTKDLIKYIKNSRVIKVYGNFSKNRIHDSLNKRCMIDRVPINFEIEIPHLIYIMNAIVAHENITDIDVTVKDMIYNGTILKNHGYGKINYICNNTSISLESNLMSDKAIKEIIIDLANNRRIIANYAIYDANLAMTQKASIEVYQDNKKVVHKYYDEDDNFYSFIKFTYYKFLNNDIGKKDKNAILNFSKIFKKFTSLIDKKD